MRALMLVGLISLALPAQQAGNANRNYTINGNGANQYSAVLSAAVAGSTASNSYTTLDPNAPVGWFASTTYTLGWLQTASNSVDIGPTPLTTIANGADPGFPFASSFRTNSSGNLNLTVPVPASLANSASCFCMAHVAPTSPDGFWVSQTHVVMFQADPNLAPGNPTPNAAATPLTLTDDSFTAITLGFSFPYYGTTWSSAFVGSNGYVTFGTGDTTLYGSATTLASSYPRISGWWRDLNPATGGTVSFYSNPAANTAEVAWTNVPNYASPAITNSFKISMIGGTANAVLIDYGTVLATDGVVGLSPGNNLATALAMNFSVGPNPIPANQAPYEEFTTTHANDLSNKLLNFTLDANGRPILQQ